MDTKLSSALEKARHEKSKGNYQKAIKRLGGAIAKNPDVIELYLEAVDACLEGSESLQATHFLKQSYARFRAESERIDAYSLEKLKATDDPVLGKFLLEQAVKKKALENATNILDELRDRTVRGLLQRTRTKKQSLASASQGGHALKNELRINLLCESLLCLRLGRMKEAVRGFLHILDEKPVENAVFEPFFAHLEKKYSKAGRIRFAYACSLYMSQQYDKATARLVQSVKMDPKIGEDGLKLLRGLSDASENLPEPVETALVEILLITGAVSRAIELLRETLSDTPENAKDVIELIESYLDDVEDVCVLRFLYVDAALLAKQTQRALNMLKKINSDASSEIDVFEWLNDKSKEQFLPMEILVYHGELAVESEQFGRAVEIFEAVVNNSPADEPTVAAIVEKHKDLDPRLAEFWKAHADSTYQPTGSDGYGFEFEHFENNEFKFSSEPELPPDEKQTEDNPTAFEPEVETVRPEDETATTQSGGDTPAETQPDASKTAESMYAETSIDENNGVLWEEEDSLGATDTLEEPPATGDHTIDEADEDVFENDGSWFGGNIDEAIDPPDEGETGYRLAPDVSLESTNSEQSSEAFDFWGVEENEGGVQNDKHCEDTQTEGKHDEDTRDETPHHEEARDEREHSPQVEIDENYVKNVSEAIRDVGAALFFHVDAGAKTPPTDTPTTDDVDREKQIEESAGEPSATNEFDRRFESFLHNDLGNGEILALVQEALNDGRIDELRELLHFEPASPDEAFLRTRYQTDYFLSRGLPAAALRVLDQIDGQSLSPERKKEILSKKAACQKEMHDFKSAHRTYLRLLEQTTSPEISAMAKRNYDQYLHDQCESTHVLVKTTSLNDD